MPLPLPTERDFSYSSGVALVEFRVDPQEVIEDLDPSKIAMRASTFVGHE
jgi:hypothetical protein